MKPKKLKVKLIDMYQFDESHTTITFLSDKFISNYKGEAKHRLTVLSKNIFNRINLKLPTEVVLVYNNNCRPEDIHIEWICYNGKYAGKK